jgi:hypothetical protein
MISKILIELSEWSKINDDNLEITVDKNKNVILRFFETSQNIPMIYTLNEYVILVQNTSFVYKNKYEVVGKIDLASNYTELQNRQ